MNNDIENPFAHRKEDIRKAREYTQAKKVLEELLKTESGDPKREELIKELSSRNIFGIEGTSSVNDVAKTVEGAITLSNSPELMALEKKEEEILKLIESMKNAVFEEYKNAIKEHREAIKNINEIRNNINSKENEELKEAFENLIGEKEKNLKTQEENIENVIEKINNLAKKIGFNEFFTKEEIEKLLKEI